MWTYLVVGLGLYREIPMGCSGETGEWEDLFRTEDCGPSYTSVSCAKPFLILKTDFWLRGKTSSFLLLSLHTLSIFKRENPGGKEVNLLLLYKSRNQVESHTQILNKDTIYSIKHVFCVYTTKFKDIIIKFNMFIILNRLLDLLLTSCSHFLSTRPY